MSESGFLIPSNYANSDNPDDLQLVALANNASDDIREMELTGAVRQGSITFDGTGSYTLPADFLSYVPDTAWVGALQVDIPIRPNEWTFQDATGVSFSQVRARFMSALKTLGDVDGEVMTFEYVSAYPWTSSTGTPKELATEDSDVWALDRRLLTLAIKWRWKKEKGIDDWQADQQLFQRHANLLRGRDSGAKTIFFGEPIDHDLSPYTRLWV